MTTRLTLHLFLVSRWITVLVLDLGPEDSGTGPEGKDIRFNYTGVKEFNCLLCFVVKTLKLKYSNYHNETILYDFFVN